MTWSVVYLCCFAVGLVLCVLSAVTGGGHVHAHLPGHVHAGRGFGGHARTPVVNGFTLTAFLCWFGGAGYLLHAHTGLLAWAVLAVASGSGVAGAALIFGFLSRVLLPHDRALLAEETPIAGVVGRVSGGLQAGGTGEILYSQLGARRSVPARSADGSAIARDAEVVVLRYEQGIAYVRPWNEFEL